MKKHTTLFFLILFAATLAGCGDNSTVPAGGSPSQIGNAVFDHSDDNGAAPDAAQIADGKKNIEATLRESPLNLSPPLDYDGDDNRELAAIGTTYSGAVPNTGLILIDPQTLVQQTVLSFGHPEKLGGIAFRFADFNADDVYDVVVERGALYDQGADDFAVLVYTDGDFTTPAFTVPGESDHLYLTQIIDLDGDDAPELLVLDRDSDNETYTYTAYDPANGFAQTAEFSFQSPVTLRSIKTPGALYDQAADFAGDGTGLQLVAFQTYETSGDGFLHWSLIDTADGSVTAQSADYALGSRGAYVTYDTADYDHDGTAEILLSLLYNDGIDSYTRHLIVGGDSFTGEYDSGQLNLLTTGFVYGAWDLDGDGAIDPLLTLATGSNVDYFALDGPGGYTERFFYDTPSGFETLPVSCHGRNDVCSGYDLTGDGDNDLLFSLFSNSLEDSLGFAVVDVETGAMTEPAYNLDLAAVGATRSEMADLDGDGVSEVIVFAEAGSIVDSGYEYAISVRVLKYQSGNLVESFVLDCGDNRDITFDTRFDVNDDGIADLLVIDRGAVPNEIDIYSCVGGCTLSDTIVSDEYEQLRLVGPML